MQQSGSYRKTRKQKQRQKRLVGLSVAAIVVIAAIVLLVALRNPLVGAWHMDEVTSYEFYRNGKGAMVLPSAEYEFIYSVEDDTLRIDFEYEGAKDSEYTFGIEGNTMTLCGGNATNQGTYILHKGD